MDLAYYGDDFTGSTDVLETLARAGIVADLFVDGRALGHGGGATSGATAIGLAGMSRTFSPAEMDARLPEAFTALAATRPRFLHYKVCSTFDSSPGIGSIGRAIEIGRHVLPARWTPLVVAAPHLGRWSAFGNLFARSGPDSPAHRLDRHPTMSRHPVTPMTEADLRLVLAEQTSLPVTLVELPTVEQGADAALEAVERAADGIVLFDAASDAHLITIGRTLDALQRRTAAPLFVAGSSGIEAAVVAAGAVGASHHGRHVGHQSPLPSGPLLVVSGSRSPVTARQVDEALRAGFHDVPLVASLADAAHGAAVASATTAHREGRSVILRTGAGDWSTLAGESLGRLLGRVAGDILDAGSVRRVVVAGGDTSGAVAHELGVSSLRFIGPLAPGAPWCRVTSTRPAIDGCAFAFKGGQVGHQDLLVVAREMRTLPA
ncbi:MAG: four-carbon acid sugar kinase family protein [Planctomycetaceae bacterium]